MLSLSQARTGSNYSGNFPCIFAGLIHPDKTVAKSVLAKIKWLHSGFQAALSSTLKVAKAAATMSNQTQSWTSQILKLLDSANWDFNRIPCQVMIFDLMHCVFNTRNNNNFASMQSKCVFLKQ